MNLTLRIPDHLAERLGTDAAALERRALEALVADGYRTGRLTKPEVMNVLGFEVGDEFDALMKAHDIYEDYTMADLELERKTLDRLGL